MLTAVYIGTVGMIVLPVLLAFYFTRTFKLSWKLVFAGALTFIASQILHIPVLYGLTALFQKGILPAIPQAWTTLFNAVLLGLLAGIFEETARWVLYKFILKKAKTWEEGVLVGVGHGGIEAFLLGIAALVSLGSVSPSLLTGPAYMGLLGFVERIFAISLHLSLSVMVLYSVAYKKPIWFWTALLWHAIVDGLAVYFLASVSALGIEGIVGICAIVSLVVLFRMRSLFIQPHVEYISPATQNS